MYQLIEGLDKHGKVTQQKLNNGLLTELASYHPATGQMISIKTSSSAGAHDKHHLTYSYDGFSNLKQQLVIANGVSNSEQYDYDGLHRLVQSSRSLNGANPSSVTVQYAYDAVGNFLSKGDFATNYQYASGKPNAVSHATKLDGSVVQYGYDNVGNMTMGDGKTLSYNAFNKPTLITKNSIRSAFSYGADLSRYKQVKTTGAKTETTHYVDKLFEKVVTQETGKATTTEYVHYIGDVAIVRKKVTAGQALPEHRIGFTHRDRLGSVVTVTDHNGNATEHRSYDAFGKPRKGDFSNPSHATLTSASGLAAGKSLIANRGFTDHEHLDEHQLIHMNGRAYDYNLGRFLSVDPFIQAPGNSQSMNPYSYIMNNPLAGTDPSGYKSECDKQDGGQCGEKPKPKPKPKEGKKKRRKTKGFSQNWSTIYQAGNGASNTNSVHITGSKEPSTLGNQTSINDNTASSVSNKPLVMTADEYLEAVKKGLWDDIDLLPGSVTNNDEVKALSEKMNMREPSSEGNVVSDRAHRDFMNKIYKATAGASNPKDSSGNTIEGEKVIALGLNGNGEVVVKGIALAAGQGGDVRAFSQNLNATAIAHVHYAGLEMKPSSGDHGVPKFLGIPNFTITHRLRRGKWSCCNVFEVGRHEGQYKYRDIKGSEPKSWQTNSDWK